MMLHPALGAALFVLGAAAGASGDWALTIEGQPHICAVDEYSCQNALEAINRGWLDWAKPGIGPLAVPIQCMPAPGCRDPRELCIPGWNCP